MTRECIICEPNWKEKDIVYAVGHVKAKKLKILTLVYGDCYAAESEYYEKIRKDIIKGISNIKLPFSETKELGRINAIDPLKITNLRIRGMWIIKAPINLFSEIMRHDSEKNICVFALMKKEKFDSFDEEEKKEAANEFEISDVLINDPNNPENKIKAKLISFSF